MQDHATYWIDLRDEPVARILADAIARGATTRPTIVSLARPRPARGFRGADGVGVTHPARSGERAPSPTPISVGPSPAGPDHFPEGSGDAPDAPVPSPSSASSPATPAATYALPGSFSTWAKRFPSLLARFPEVVADALGPDLDPAERMPHPRRAALMHGLARSALGDCRIAPHEPQGRTMDRLDAAEALLGIGADDSAQNEGPDLPDGHDVHPEVTAIFAEAGALLAAGGAGTADVTRLKGRLISLGWSGAIKPIDSFRLQGELARILLEPQGSAPATS